VFLTKCEQQSADIKKWLHAPTLQSQERQKFCLELDKVEQLLFEKQSYLDSLLSSSNHRKGEQDTSKSMLHVTTREEILKLESERKELLNEYWSKYFKQEWPSSTTSTNVVLQQQHLFKSKPLLSWSSPLFPQNSSQTNNSSPNLQHAAELLAMSRNSTSLHWGSGSPIENTVTDGGDVKKGKKRGLDIQPSTPAEAAAAMVGLHQPHQIHAGFHSTTKTTILVEPVDAGGEDGTEAVPIRCNCKKSRCLKLYCECFAARKMCVGECKCVDCANNQEHAKKREEAIRQVLDRRPDAFHTKVFIATSSNGIQTKATGVNGQGIVVVEPTAPVALAHARGCSCRRTKCTKKYCVCFNTNVKCGEWCRCVGCANGKENSGEQSADGEGAEEEEEEEPRQKNHHTVPALSTTDAAAIDALSVLAKIGAAASPVQAQ
jgi:hypothetical protein